MSTFSYALKTPMPVACVGGVIAIGNFDGVHLGHQTLLAEVVRQARELAAPSIVVTFDPHPIQLLRPERVDPFLTTPTERASLLHDYGVEHVVFLQTSPALLQLDAREFFEKIVMDQFKARGMVEGFNFAFGKNREGTLEVLRVLCDESKVRLTLVPPCEQQGKPVSSSRVRAELLAGNVAFAAELLRRSYRISGSVGTGQKRGAKLGFPTANLEQIATLIPGNGVYAGFGCVDGISWPAAVNVGPNPTFGENARKVETHLIDFKGDLYGKSMSIDFVQKIRDTKPFGSVQELVTQIQSDVVQAKKLLGAT